MSTYKTLGIVIKRRNINEADRLLTVLTEKHGKITVVAKGVRKPLSRLGSHLEPFHLVNLVLAEGRNMDTVTGAVVEHYNNSLHNDLNKVGRASRFSELIDVFTHDKEEHRKLFHLFNDCLTYLDGAQRKGIDLYFFVNTLSILGYCPELYECVSCRREIKPETIGWNDEHGGVVCDECVKDGKQVSSDAIKVLRLFLDKNVYVLEKIYLTDSLVKSIEELLSGFVSHINQKELKCDKFLRNIGGSLC